MLKTQLYRSEICAAKDGLLLFRDSVSVLSSRGMVLFVFENFTLKDYTDTIFLNVGSTPSNGKQQLSKLRPQLHRDKARNLYLFLPNL